jgi:nucleoid-associated protein YgaU
VLPDASKTEALDVSQPAPVAAVSNSELGSVSPRSVGPEKALQEPASAGGAGLPPVDAPTVETAPIAEMHPPAGDASGSTAGVSDKHSEAGAPQFRAVPVTEGDTLVALAREIYGNATPEVLDQIKTANPQILDVNHILAGDTLYFPVVNREPTGAQFRHE